MTVRAMERTTPWASKERFTSHIRKRIRSCNNGVGFEEVYIGGLSRRSVRSASSVDKQRLESLLERPDAVTQPAPFVAIVLPLKYAEPSWPNIKSTAPWNEFLDQTERLQYVCRQVLPQCTTSSRLGPLRSQARCPGVGRRQREHIVNRRVSLT